MKKYIRRILPLALSFVLLMNISSGALAAGNVAVNQQTIVGNDQSKTIITQQSTNEKAITHVTADNEVDYTATVTEEGNIRTTIMVTDQYTIRSVSDMTKPFTATMYIKPTGAPDSAYELAVEITEEDLQQSALITPNAVLVEYHHGTFFEYDYYRYDTGKRQLFINHQVAEAQPGKFTSQCNTFLSSSKAADEGMEGVLSSLIGAVPVVGSFASGCFNIIYTEATDGASEEMIADLLISYAISIGNAVVPGLSVVVASLDACRMIYHCNRVHTSWNTVRRG